MYLQRLVYTSDRRAVRHDIFSIPNLLHDNIPKIGDGVCIYVTLSGKSSLILGENKAGFRRESHIC